ncbi:MAG: hypothetical protein ACJARD_001565 [Alphaproteobacteria bacterium]|jgi:hypothetical protein
MTNNGLNMFNNINPNISNSIAQKITGFLDKVRMKTAEPLASQQQKDFNIIKKVLNKKIPNSRELKNTQYQNCKTYQDCLKIISMATLKNERISIDNNQFKGFLKDNRKTLQEVFTDISATDKSIIIDRLVANTYSSGKDIERKALKKVLSKVVQPRGSIISDAFSDSIFSPPQRPDEIDVSHQNSQVSSLTLTSQ